MDTKRLILLGVALVLIVGGIYYIESQKAAPSGQAGTASDPAAGLEEDDRNDEETVKEPEVVSEEDLARINQKAKQYEQAPELRGISGYLNTDGEAIRISDFKDKVVLIDFWTYTCINCIRTLPHLKEWHDKYADDGLVIIGVHTPEFEFEKEYENVRMAAEKYNLEYPIVQDNDYMTWRAYKNRFWPHKYLIDADGFIRYDHIGEGKYEETEEFIRALLAEAGKDVDEDSVQEAEDTTPDKPQTPELYAGYRFALPRGQDIGNPEGLRPDETFDYDLPIQVKGDRIYLDGRWHSHEDNLEALEANASIYLGFTSTAANIVAAPGESGPIEMDVRIDTRYLTEGDSGDDIRFDGDRSYVLVDEPRLYNVYRGDYDQHLLTLTPRQAGFSFNAFTFG